MGSTQNKNSNFDYLCEKQQNKQVLDYYTFNHYGVNPSKDYFFSIGSVPNMPRDKLSFNPVDTESFLRNIGSTNLENTSTQIQPKDKSIFREDILFYERNNTILPDPMIVFKNQRFGLN